MDFSCRNRLILAWNDFGFNAWISRKWEGAGSLIRSILGMFFRSRILGLGEVREENFDPFLEDDLDGFREDFFMDGVTR